MIRINNLYNSVEQVFGGGIIKQGNCTSLGFRFRYGNGALVNLKGVVVKVNIFDDKKVILEKQVNILDEYTIELKISSVEQFKSLSDLKIKFIIIYPNNKQEEFPSENFQYIKVKLENYKDDVTGYIVIEKVTREIQNPTNILKEQDLSQFESRNNSTILESQSVESVGLNLSLEKYFNDIASKYETVEAKVGSLSDLKNKDKKSLVSAINKQKYYVSISEFPREPLEANDAPRWQRAIDSLINGGVVIGEAAEYSLNKTVTVKENVSLIGQGFGRFKTGTAFRYLGEGAAFNFTTKTAGIQLVNFKIYSKVGDASYQKFVGIDINFAELVTIENITIENANIGIDCSGSLGSIYLLNIINPFIYNCLNEGINIRSGTWKNGIYIKVGEINNNSIGIRCGRGNGNTIDGNASEIGNNRLGGILIEDGVWTIRGNLWIEGSGYGIKTTGGHSHILGDVYCISEIIQEGGSLIVDYQANIQPLQPSAIKEGLQFWYSFEEGQGSATYDKSNGYKGTFSSVPLWNSDKSVYGTTVEGQSASIPYNKIDWTLDWTVLALVKGSNSGYFLLVKGSDGVENFILRPYPKGVQLSINSIFEKNFATFPNGDATTRMNWHILSYNAERKELCAYSQSGKLQASYKFTINPEMKNPTLVNLGSSGIVCDEIIIYSRLLTDSEIRAITQIKVPSNMQGDNFTMLKSPDGSTWKITIDNEGKLKSTKM